MTWSVEWDERARKELRKLDAETQTRILRYLRERVCGPNSPRRIGKALAGGKSGFWRYRVGSCRLICAIEDRRLVVLVVAVGQRREIYR